MGITFNPIEAIKTFISNKRDNRKRAGEYLEEIAREASELATIWQVIVGEILKTGIYEVPDDIRKHRMILAQAQCCNISQSSRLGEHYREVSSVLGAEFYDEMDPIVFHIGRLLRKREITRALVEKQLSSLSSAAINHEENSLQSFANIQESVNALHREASRLHVLAQKFKAK